MKVLSHFRQLKNKPSQGFKTKNGYAIFCFGVDQPIVKGLKPLECKTFKE